MKRSGNFGVEKTNRMNMFEDGKGRDEEGYGWVPCEANKGKLEEE